MTIRLAKDHIRRYHRRPGGPRLHHRPPVVGQFQLWLGIIRKAGASEHFETVCRFQEAATWFPPNQAGWSGFCLARWLMRRGVEVYVVQPSSVPVDRRMRRAKSDGIDSELLLRTLLAWLRGEPRVCSMVPVPDEADEDARRCVRERTELISERIGLTNRIGAVLATLGVSDYNPLLRNRYRRLAELRTGLGEPLPANAHAKIKRLLARLELVLTQIAELERERDAVMETEASDKASRMIQQLAGLRGIGASNLSASSTSM